MQQENLIWHYTTKVHYPNIVNDGFLRPSKGDKIMGAKPALWFSKNPIWEPTATKLAGDSLGNIYKLTPQQQFESFGMIRFGIEFDDSLISWSRYKHKSNIKTEWYCHLEQSGIEQGANPKDWFVSFQRVTSDKWLTVQEFDGEKWKVLTLEEHINIIENDIVVHFI
ncbi:MAG: hypothetical protein HYI21_00390 [Sediminibacterium sp. Gen4]|jgi:hypothetical protein|uniref:hypothetical protein n=1 Tax=unclassified Sediminibacterium TaxID=2635961 RepID=UPI0015BE42D9|nr:MULTISPECIES: hypothetical protein [unclassified Sediminibacterium]MBW0161805.1 hypothetical protein [Sediminibacterium sp.]MBW0165010.1 hypothetical protein [Sediminibacterium sp.]NWK64465.1 hypothetical protein [Sediminibacterium sp. Gen4]